MKKLIFAFILLSTTVGFSQEKEKTEKPSSELEMALLRQEIQQLKQQMQQAGAPQRAQEIKDFIDQRVKATKADLVDICKKNEGKWMVSFASIDNKTVIISGCVGK